MKERTYSVEQFPKNKIVFDLSEQQKAVRKGKRKYTKEKERTCSKCHKTQAISEFYVRDKQTGRRNRSCRDCQMRAAQVVEIGKFRFAKKILKKGFRRCSICKNIQPISNFPKSKKTFGGHLNTCNDCSYRLSHSYIVKQRQEIGLFFIKQYGKQKHGYSKFTKPLIEKLRLEIIESRKPKYHIDGLEFFTLNDFARYIEKQYDLPMTMTIKRIEYGKTEEECKLSEKEMRSLAYSQGKIRVTDTVTGKLFEFNNTRDAELRKMFSTATISHCIKSGQKTRITSLSKYKNPCTIERVPSTPSPQKAAGLKTEI